MILYGTFFEMFFCAKWPTFKERPGKTRVHNAERLRWAKTQINAFEQRAKTPEQERNSATLFLGFVF